MTDAKSDTRKYETVYSRFREDAYRAVRRASFGEDIGQNSWLTAPELRRFCAQLTLSPASHVLEAASGDGEPAIFMAEETGCQVAGVDIQRAGVAAANETVGTRQLAVRARFRGSLRFAETGSL